VGCGSGAKHGASSASATSTASAPACLPASTDVSATLAGTPVSVSPTPGTDTADPQTQISFLGAPAGQIRVVSVVGSRSGQHPGHLEVYSQGDGASFVPTSVFLPGEQVVVHATINGAPAQFAFGVDTPWSTAAIPQFGNPAALPSDYQSFVTLPGVQAPNLTVTAPDRDPSAGDIFTSNGPGPGRYGPVIYTPQGRLVWFDQLPTGVAAENVSVQSYEGQRDLTLWEGRVLSLGFGQGEDIVMNDHYQTIATVRGGNGLQADLHDFQIAPNGTAYITAYNPIHCDLASQDGPRNGAIVDTVVEAIDMRTGLVRWEWHALDHVAVSESETSPPSKTPWDWFHLNSIDPEPNGDLLISARSTWAAYELQAPSGKILWRLGGLKSSFRMGPGTRTAWQHDARLLANGDITMFDDGSDPPEEPQSRAVRIALDPTTHQARLVSALTHPGVPLLAPSQGNMQTLPDGNTVVGYGGVPQITEYAANGTLLFDSHLPLDQVFYRAFRFPWNGSPLGPPAVAANLNNTSEETIVHMSWNGATAVASWRVLARAQSGALSSRAVIGTSGFESSTILPTHYAYVAVQPLDSAGRPLGTSPTVPVKPYAASLPNDGRSG